MASIPGCDGRLRDKVVAKSYTIVYLTSCVSYRRNLFFILSLLLIIWQSHTCTQFLGCHSHPTTVSYLPGTSDILPIPPPLYVLLFFLIFLFGSPLSPVSIFSWNTNWSWCGLVQDLCRNHSCSGLMDTKAMLWVRKHFRICSPFGPLKSFPSWEMLVLLVDTLIEFES